MSITDTYRYTLQSCNPGSYPDIIKVCTAVNPSPFDGLIVYIDETPFASVQAETYLVVSLGLNSGPCTNGWMPNLVASNLTSCADPNNDKMYKLINCADGKLFRYVLFVAAQTIGNVIRFDGECTCWRISELISTYTESPTVAATFDDCTPCQEQVVSENCEYEERTIGYAVKVGLPSAEPPDRGFVECCYSQVVLGDLSSTDPYKNDYNGVFYKRQTPNDTITYDLIGVSTGTTVLADVTHGQLYPFGTAEQPDLSYFIVDWKKILNVLGEDTYTIRKNITIAGVVAVIDSNSFELKQWSVANADNTVRIDSYMDGKLVKIDTDFKNSGYKNSMRIQGYFGDRQAKFTQDNLVFGSKKGKAYYEDQITMSNNFEYLFQAYNIPECIARELYSFMLFGNEIFISDYNINNHSYLFELQPVTLLDDSGAKYNVTSRGVDVNLTFVDRTKDNRKTNC